MLSSRLFATFSISNGYSGSLISIRLLLEQYSFIFSAQETIFALPDLNNDGYGGSLYRYHSCLNNVAVELFLMEQIAHDWPTDLNDYDIIAADEIWNFLKQFDINGRIAQ